MTERDYDGFVLEFRRIAAALERYRQSPEEARAKADAYFHVLKQFPLSEVIAKAGRWLATETKFPRPVEWASVILRKVVDYPVLSEADAREHFKAEHSGYEADPCKCASCVAAGVEWKPRRYVPELSADGTDRKVKDPMGNRIVIAGHWAHGEELARWYAAKGAFYERCAQLGVHPSQVQIGKKRAKDARTFEQRLEHIFKPKQDPEAAV